MGRNAKKHGQKRDDASSAAAAALQSGSSELHVTKRGGHGAGDKHGSNDKNADSRDKNEPNHGKDEGTGDENLAPHVSVTTPQRQGSGVSSRKVSDGLKQLSPGAYQFVRESYLMLDSDGTGSVSRETLREMLSSLGLRDSGDRQLNAMLQRTGEPITFAAYLAVMGDLLGDLPPRDEMDLMLEAFQRRDGSFDETALRDALLGEGLKSEEISSVMQRFKKPARSGDAFDPKLFASTMSV